MHYLLPKKNNLYTNMLRSTHTLKRATNSTIINIHQDIVLRPNSYVGGETDIRYTKTIVVYKSTSKYKKDLKQTQINTVQWIDFRINYLDFRNYRKEGK